MSADSESLSADRLVAAICILARTMVWLLLHALRIALLAVLSICEPLVRGTLSLLCLAGLFTATLYYFGGSPGLKVSYGILLAFTFGSAGALALYERFLDLLRR